MVLTKWAFRIVNLIICMTVIYSSLIAKQLWSILLETMVAICKLLFCPTSKFSEARRLFKMLWKNTLKYICQTFAIIMGVECYYLLCLEFNRKLHFPWTPASYCFTSFVPELTILTNSVSWTFLLFNITPPLLRWRNLRLVRCFSWENRVTSR